MVIDKVSSDNFFLNNHKSSKEYSNIASLFKAFPFPFKNNL